jgi:ATP-dependent Clp protease adaptor protein ClpS
VPIVISTAPAEAERPVSDTRSELQTPWVTIVWNDPVNLMSYVTYVFQSYFGYPRATAESLMRDVHSKGRAVVSSGSLEEMERDTEAMHGFGLWATFSQDR